MKTIDHGKDVESVCFSPDGKNIATASLGTKSARIFDVSTGKEISINNEPAVKGPMTVCYSPDGKSIATGSYDGFLRIWDVQSGVEIMKDIGQHDGEWVRSVCFSPDGKRIVTGCKDFFARIFDVSSGQQILKTMKHGRNIDSVCFSPDGKSIATASGSGFAHIFHVDVSDGKEVKTIEHKTEIRRSGALGCSFFSPDGKSIATISDSAEDRCARVFDVGSGNQIMKTFQNDWDGTTYAACFSPDGKSIAVGFHEGGYSTGKNFVSIFDVGSGDEIMKTKPIDSRLYIKTCCFSPDGKCIATAWSDKFLRIFDVGSGEIMKTIDHGITAKSLEAVCFSPDGKCIATGCQDKFLRIFDVGSGEIMKTIEHEREMIGFVCFSPDGKCIATYCGFSGDCARVFDIGTGEQIIKTIANPSTLGALCFSPDGKSIAMGFCESFSHIFRIDSSDKSQNQALKPCMIFAGLILISSSNRVALIHKHQLLLFPHPFIFSSECWLPVSSCMVLEWSRLPQELQDQCCITASQVIHSEYFALKGGGLVHLASKWQNPDFPHALSCLKRLFDGDEPIFNAGLILRELLRTRSDLNDLPDAATIEALLRNVSRHSRFSVGDCVLTQQLAHAACISSIQSIVGEFWIEQVQLVPSHSSVVYNVQHVSFSEVTRMYVAASQSTSEPVFESYFAKHQQSKGQLLDYEHYFVPFSHVSAHRDGVKHTTACGTMSRQTGMQYCTPQADGDGLSMMQALVDTENIDIFGSISVRAIVMHKWTAFGLSRWLKEFFIYSIGLALLVALSILTWQLALHRDDSISVPPADIAVVSALFGAVIIRSLYRETKQFFYSIPSGNEPLLRRILSSDQFRDFWNWLDFLHIAFGISVVILVWVQNPHALPVLAITSFLRWWGTLFYLQAFDRTGPYIRMLVEIIKTIRWFMFIMFISILATWNSFILLLKRPCLGPEADATCESLRDSASVFRTMYDMVNTLLFGSGDLASLENTEHFGLVVFIFIVSMIGMPIVLLNMLIAIMGDSYELIQDRALRESVMMKARILLEIELFMNEAEKKNSTFFPKFLHVIVPEGEAKSGPSEYQGLMNALKRKVDEGVQNTQDDIAKMQKEVQDRLADTHVGIAKMQKELEAKLSQVSQETLELKSQQVAAAAAAAAAAAGIAKMQKELSQETLELKGQLSEILQLLRSKS